MWALGKEMQERVSEGERERLCMWYVCVFRRSSYNFHQLLFVIVQLFSHV